MSNTAIKKSSIAQIAQLAGQVNLGNSGLTLWAQDETLPTQLFVDITVKNSKSGNLYFAMSDGDRDYPLACSGTLYTSLQEGQFTEGEVVSGFVIVQSPVQNITDEELEDAYSNDVASQASARLSKTLNKGSLLQNSLKTSKRFETGASWSLLLFNMCLVVRINIDTY